jgi:hypothetical protein
MVGIFSVAGPATAVLAAPQKPAAITAAATDNSTGSPAYLRCRAAGGTDHFCGDLGGYWYFN